MRGLIVAAPRSGAGKTTVALMVLAALRRRGVRVRAAKAGPDYLDPGFLAAASGADCVNLDTWAMPPALVAALLAAAGGDLLVVESAMGLFDGTGSQAGRSGAAADLAAAHGLPVLLVLDVSGQSQSAAAVARGFATHRDGVRVAGVVLNRVGSERHARQAGAAVEAAGLKVLGALRRDAGIALPERHLGLVQAMEHPALAAALARLADAAEAALDLDAIVALAAPVGGCGGAGVALPPPGQRIAVARDAAFGFLYPHVVRGWRQAGAEIVPFAPLDDAAPDADCDACWLPGGYPELHAGRIAAASRFLAGLADFARTRPVHGECGGYMVLGQALTDADGAVHRMAGLLGHATSFAARRMTLGYRRAVLAAPTGFARAGTALRGHEFHYATETRGGDAPLARMADAAGADLGPAGGVRGRVTGSFFHVIAGEA